MRRFPAFIFLVLLALGPFLSRRPPAVRRVVTDVGRALPGVTVEARGPALQGDQVTLPSGRGIPPRSFPPVLHGLGVAPQFGPRRARHKVGLDRHGGRGLEPPRAGSRIVSHGRRAGDRHDVDQARHEPQPRAIQTLPTGRNYASVVQIAPGVVQSDADPEGDSITVYGSSGAENAFFVDGVNTTGVEYGFQGKELNFEFIQAVDVKTGGYEAEFGRSTGGIINVITKSGGNEFHGDVFGYYDADSLQSDAETRRLHRRHARRLHARGLRRSTSAATSSRTSSGSSPPTTR